MRRRIATFRQAHRPADEQEFASVERAEAEAGIAFDQSAVAEPEIETEEGSEAGPQEEPNESAAAEGDSGEAGSDLDVRARPQGWSSSRFSDSSPTAQLPSVTPHNKFIRSRNALNRGLSRRVLSAA